MTSCLPFQASPSSARLKTVLIKDRPEKRSAPLAETVDPAVVPCLQAAYPAAVYVAGSGDISMPSDSPSSDASIGSIVTTLPAGATDIPLRSHVHLIQVLTFRGF